MSTPKLGPAARNAGLELASAKYGQTREQAERALDPATIAALAMLAIDLIRSCIAARRGDQGTTPNGFEVVTAARRLRRASWLKPWTWPDRDARRQLESVAGRRSVPRLARSGLAMTGPAAVGLALEVAEDADPNDLDLLIREADGEGDEDGPVTPVSDPGSPRGG
ncbi:hypothetical protein AB1L88_15565 [Tautonia sp. JC769]|uniref:hypothetical protein n=1 Tax=Tautonia sp. JC769 TaxID=3232135 RepID=UPI00345753EF